MSFFEPSHQMLGQWVTIQIKVGATDRWDRPALAYRVYRLNPLHPEKGEMVYFYWNGSPSHFCVKPESDLYRVLEEYPLNDFLPDYVVRDTATDDQLDDAEEAIEKKFLRTYAATDPVDPHVNAGFGWIAPDGKWYVCHYTEHESAAYALCTKCYNILAGSDELHKRGWIEIKGGGSVCADPREAYPLQITQAQFDTIWDLSQVIAITPQYHRNELDGVGPANGSSKVWLESFRQAMTTNLDRCVCVAK